MSSTKKTDFCTTLKYRIVAPSPALLAGEGLH
jgi:hypothetical protein